MADVDLKTELQSLLDTSVQLVRDGQMLNAQSVRLHFSPRAGERVSAGGSVVAAPLRLYGDSSLDAQRGDRFQSGGQWFRVVLVHPDYVDDAGTAVMTVADCEIEA